MLASTLLLALARALPIGEYGISAEAAGDWWIVRKGLEPFVVAEGGLTELGELDPIRGAPARNDYPLPKR